MTGAISKGTASVVAAAVAAVFLFGASSVARAAGSFSVRPGQSDPADPATRAYFKPLVNPGRSAYHSVIVANTGTNTVHLRVYAVDGLTGKTTGTVYANRRDRVRKAGEWVTPRVSEITISAGKHVPVAFTIRVPTSAKAGDHVAGIAFEDVNPRVSGARFRITEIIREVIGIQVRVPGRAFPRLTLRGVSLKPLPGTKVASVVVGLGNRGLRLCKPKLAVSLRGPHGYRRSVASPLDTVLPGDTVAYPQPWPGTLRNGRYVTNTSASCRGRRVARRAVVTLGKSIGPGAKRGSSSSIGGIPLWLLVAVALGCVGTGVALGRIQATRGRRAMAAGAGAGPPDGSSTSGQSGGQGDDRL
jgi:hypothetical protein